MKTDGCVHYQLFSKFYHADKKTRCYRWPAIIVVCWCGENVSVKVSFN